MLTQLTCPNCQTPYTAEVHQLIDAKQNPELKQMLLSGQLNVAVCPNCGAGGQMATPIVYHDPDHELFMIYTPQELNMPQQQREEMIGRVTRQVMEATPQEQRKAYMFQPTEILSMQTFMEKVLETEGITKEMIERQKKQSELLRTLAQADKDVQDHLIKERGREIDETFFAMLQQAIDQISQMGDPNQALPFINLRAKLMTETAVGRDMEKRQIALHKFNRAAKAADGISPELLLEHVLLNQEDMGTVQALAMSAQNAFSYNFFELLTKEIEKQEAAGNDTAVQRLSQIRTDLLEIFEERQKQTEQMVAAAEETLQAILKAPDKKQAIRQHASQIDDLFMYVLSMRQAQAEQQGNQEILNALNAVQDALNEEMANQLPPEIMLINELMEAESDAAQDAILDENAAMVSPQLVELLDAVLQQTEETGRTELNGRLNAIKARVQARL